MLRFGFAFVVLFVVTLPFPLSFFPSPANSFHAVFQQLNLWSARHVFGITTGFSPDLDSDTTGLYLHVFHLLLFSAVAAFIWLRFSRHSSRETALKYIFHTSASYILAFFLLKYGLDKLFKAQFYLPEPNTLYTPLGLLSKDILFWSTIGSSYSYSFFSGLLEVVPALLLFSRKTRMLGGFIASGVLLHVWVINFSFDISVKILSSYLLVLTCIVLLPYCRNLYRFFIAEQTSMTTPAITTIYRDKTVRSRALKAFVLISMIFECLFVYVSNNQFNDDLAPRPKFHGAYDVQKPEGPEPAYSAYFGDLSRIRRIFIHRRGYLIIQFTDDSMQDFPLALNPAANLLYLNTASGPLTITVHHYGKGAYDFGWKEGSRELGLKTHQTDLKALPLFQDDFTWSIDAYTNKKPASSPQ